jgi:hypothetical protein
LDDGATGLLWTSLNKDGSPICTPEECAAQEAIATKFLGQEPGTQAQVAAGGATNSDEQQKPKQGRCTIL